MNLEIDNGNKWKKNPYIPLTKTPDIVEYSSMQILPNKPSVKDFNSSSVVNGNSNESEKIGLSDVEDEKSDDNNFIRRRRRWNEVNLQQQNSTSNGTVNATAWKAIPTSNVIIFTKDEQIVLPSAPQSVLQKRDDSTTSQKEQAAQIPHFQVSYWMFYPYSQGKTICTLNLGPLGPIPIPLIWNMCLGTKKEFGGHVGDWEHFSLSFRGRMEPEVKINFIKLS